VRTWWWGCDEGEEGAGELIEPEVLMWTDRLSTFVVVSMEDGITTSTPWDNARQQYHLHSSSRQAAPLFKTPRKLSSKIRIVVEAHGSIQQPGNIWKQSELFPHPFKDSLWCLCSVVSSLSLFTQVQWTLNSTIILTVPCVDLYHLFPFLSLLHCYNGSWIFASFSPLSRRTWSLRIYLATVCIAK
jgi:hypothetical protein